MKAIKLALLLFILTLPFLNVYGQSDLFGTWKASCFLERNSNGSLAICGICPTKISDNPHDLNIKEFELEINDKQLSITVDGKTTFARYKWDKTLEAISFEFEKSPYSFKVLRGIKASTIILKETNCGLILLNKQ